MISWTQAYTKTQYIAKNNNANILAQLQQDWNTGYHIFNNKLARYYARKQQFANAVTGQGIYQTPIDSIRVVGMSFQVNSNYEPVLKEVRDEEEWRWITSVKQIKTNWPIYYFVLGPDLVSIWPLPSQNADDVIRFYYQPDDYDLSVDDVVSSNITASLTNGTNIVTASSGTPWTSQMAGLSLQITGQTNLLIYEIYQASTTQLTLKNAYVGPTSTTAAWRIAQFPIIPQAYQDAPMHYALGNYFSSTGNESRAAYHLGLPDKPGMFWDMVNQCRQDFSSSTRSSVITEDDLDIAGNQWFLNPPASTNGS